MIFNHIMDLNYFGLEDSSGNARARYKYLLRSTSGSQVGKIRVDILSLWPTHQPDAMQLGFNEVDTDNEATAFYKTVDLLNSHHSDLRGVPSPVKEC